MLVELVRGLLSHFPSWQWLVAFQKITFRASLAAVIGFALALVLGRRLIAWLQTRFREPIKSASSELCELQRHKHATPTMGGIFIVAGVAVTVLLLADLRNSYLHIAMGLCVALACLGACDDLAKIKTAARGISPRTKLAGQIGVALVAAMLLYRLDVRTPEGLEIAVPLTAMKFSLGWLFVPWAVAVIVASSNAVNLTDGLDGLAGGCLMFALGALAVIVYASGHREWAQYLGVTHVAGAGEMVVLAGGLLGGILGFLWFNCHPASVFMGDTGSLPLGGLLGFLALVARQEFLLLLVGGVFVVEAASVIAQVSWYKLRGRRIFLCAPLHHHFQFKGWPETQIVARFWIVSALCAISGLAALKLRLSETPVEVHSAAAPSPLAVARANP